MRWLLEAHVNAPSTHLVPLVYTAIAAGGLLVAIVGASNFAMVAIGLGIAVVADATAGIAWRRSGPVGDRISTNVWWKLVLTGPCIVAAVVIAAGLGVDAWMLGMFAVFVACVVTATGVLLGIARLAQRHSRAIPT